MKHRFVFNALLIAGGVALGWVGHSVTTAVRPTMTDSVAANWTTLAVALVGEDGIKSSDAVKDSTMAALVTLTPTLGMNFRQLDNSQLKSNVMGLARKMLAHPEMIASLKLPVNGESANLVLTCISIYGGLDPGNVEKCSNTALSLKSGEPG